MICKTEMCEKTHLTLLSCILSVLNVHWSTATHPKHVFWVWGSRTVQQLSMRYLPFLNKENNMKLWDTYQYTLLVISSDEADVHFAQIIPTGIPVSMFLSVCLWAIDNSWASLMKSVETIELRAITGLRFNEVKCQSSSYSVSINVSQCEPERGEKMRL